MTTFKQAVERFIDQVRVGDKPIAFYDTADSVSTATTLTHVRRFANSTYGSSQYKGRWLERPTCTGNNKLKRIDSVNTTTGAATHDGVVYVAESAETYYRVWDADWHPTDYVAPLLNRALEEAWTWWREVLSLVPNAGGENAAVGGTDSSATTTRITTAASVFVGQAALQVALSGANGIHYATFDAGAGQPFVLRVWVRITTGTTAFVRVFDNTNASATIVEQTVTGNGQWHLVELSGQFPSNCYLGGFSVGSSSATAVVVYDSPALYWGDLTLIEGPSWVTQWRDNQGMENARLIAVKPRHSAPSPGRSYDTELVEASSYQIINMPSDANPVRFELGRDVWEKGALFIEAKRPYSHFNSTGSGVVLAAETDSNTIPLRLWDAAARMLCGEERGLPQRQLWAEQYHEEQRKAQSWLRAVTPGQRGLTWRRGR